MAAGGGVGHIVLLAVGRAQFVGWVTLSQPSTQLVLSRVTPVAQSTLEPTDPAPGRRWRLVGPTIDHCIASLGPARGDTQYHGVTTAIIGY